MSANGVTNAPASEQQSLRLWFENHQRLAADEPHPVDVSRTECDIGITLPVHGLDIDSYDNLKEDAEVAVVFTARADAVGREPDGTAAVIEHRTGSRRTLAVPRFVANHLARHIDQYPPSADGFLFTGPNGGGLRRSNFRKRVWIQAVGATLGQPCAFHDLRHTHAAMLIREGQHPKVIQLRMGHASIRTTLDTYGHLFPGMDEAAADALDESFRGVSSLGTRKTGWLRYLHDTSPRV